MWKKEKCRIQLQQEPVKNKKAVHSMYGFHHESGVQRTRTAHLNTASVALQPDELMPLIFLQCKDIMIFVKGNEIEKFFLHLSYGTYCAL